MAGRGSVSSQLLSGGECGGTEGAVDPTRRRCQMEAVGRVGFDSSTEIGERNKENLSSV